MRSAARAASSTTRPGRASMRRCESIPAHPKALWLRASLQTQRKDYAAALVTWQQLADVLPADSPDARIIAANIDEARGKLSARAASPAQPALRRP